jgi:hydrogenase expression/formation protein HypC
MPPTLSVGDRFWRRWAGWTRLQGAECSISRANPSAITGLTEPAAADRGLIPDAAIRSGGVPADTQQIQPGEDAMCLGIPAQVLEVDRFDDLGIVEGKVDFSGVQKQVNLSFTPEVEPGDWVVVHVGFSISVLDEEEARRTLEYLRELGEMEVPEGRRPH